MRKLRNPANDAGVQVIGADEIEQRALGIGIRDHRVGAHFLAADKHDADRAAGLDHYVVNQRVGAHFAAGRHNRRRQRVADGAHAASGQGERAALAAGIAAGAEQEIEHRVWRARPERMAEHAVEGERTLERGALEAVVEQIGGVHTDDTQQFAHVVAAQASDAEAELEIAEALAPAGRLDRRRRRQQHRPQRAREAHHARAERRVALGVARRELRQRVARRRRVRRERQMPAVGQQRDCRQVAPAVVEAVARQAKIGDHLGMHEVQDVSAGRHVVAGVDLLGRRRAAGPRARLADHHLAAGLGEIGRADQAVVAAADDHRVRHVSSPLAKSSRISRAALAPGAAMTPPPGWVDEPHM